MNDEQATCSGACLTGADIGIPGPGIAYPHPDCPAHGDDWVPRNNEWSRQYVAEHPERFDVPSSPSAALCDDHREPDREETNA